MKKISSSFNLLYLGATIALIDASLVLTHKTEDGKDSYNSLI